jgi:hypothetical protein
VHDMPAAAVLDLLHLPVVDACAARLGHIEPLQELHMGSSAKNTSPGGIFSCTAACASSLLHSSLLHSQA